MCAPVASRLATVAETVELPGFPFTVILSIYDILDLYSHRGIMRARTTTSVRVLRVQVAKMMTMAADVVVVVVRRAL